MAFRSFAGSIKVKAHMRRCSWFVIVGFALLVIGLAFFGYHYWYAGEHLPDFPKRDDGKIVHTPRFDAQIGAVFGAGLVLLVTSVISLVGIAIGPRTLWCVLAGLLGPALMGLPFLVANFRSVWSAARAMFL